LLKSSYKKKDDEFQAQKLILPGKKADAQDLIRRIILKASNELRIIDPYMSGDIFNLYLSHLAPKVSIKILTYNLWNKFIKRAIEHKKTRGDIQVKRSTNIHDRYILIDSDAWMIGSSLKDAGNKLTTLVKMDKSELVFKMFDNLWLLSQNIL